MRVSNECFEAFNEEWLEISVTIISGGCCLCSSDKLFNGDFNIGGCVIELVRRCLLFLLLKIISVVSCRFRGFQYLWQNLTPCLFFDSSLLDEIFTIWVGEHGMEDLTPGFLQKEWKTCLFNIRRTTIEYLYDINIF